MGDSNLILDPMTKAIVEQFITQFRNRAITLIVDDQAHALQTFIHPRNQTGAVGERFEYPHERSFSKRST
jgi:hypothetical protein